MHDLRPQSHQSVSLCDALDRVLNTGVVALGEVVISVAEIDLLYVGLQLVVTSIESGKAPGQLGEAWREPVPRDRGGPAPLAERAGDSRPHPASASPFLPVPPAPEENVAIARPVSHGLQPEAPQGSSRARDKNGLGRLVLTLIRVLHELLKRQSLRRMEAGSITLPEIERLGVTLQRQAQELERIAQDLGLELDDLNLDLGPLGRLL